MSPTTSYQRIFSVDRRAPDGIELMLALQIRSSVRWPMSWPTLSWRTRLRPAGPNRRFYILDDEPWMIRAVTAFDMLAEAQRRGALDDAYLDPRPRAIFDTFISTDPIAQDRAKIFEEITMPSESWGEEPFWIALEEHGTAGRVGDGPWRKVMIINTQSGEATFRSTTTDQNYKPRKVLRAGLRWALDNSMPDINVQQSRVFIELLRTVLGVARPTSSTDAPVILPTSSLI